VSQIPESWLQPDWPAPDHVRAVITSRIGGVSKPPYDSLNLSARVGDEGDDVMRNRSILQQTLALQNEPMWLKQVHGCTVADASIVERNTSADAAVCNQPAVVCAVLIADCLPVLFCDKQGKRIGIAHAGWRGLARGVIEATVDALKLDPERILVWLGPAIGPQAFEVSDEVRQVFITQDQHTENAFEQISEHKWLADIYHLALIKLSALSIKAVYGGELCTFERSEQFYSYRRNKVTGRMASLIWLCD